MSFICYNISEHMLRTSSNFKVRRQQLATGILFGFALTGRVCTALHLCGETIQLLFSSFQKLAYAPPLKAVQGVRIYTRSVLFVDSDMHPSLFKPNLNKRSFIMGRTRHEERPVMTSLIDGLTFALLVILVAIGWLLWQRHTKSFGEPDGNES